MKRIAFTGKFGVGKSTAAKYLTTEYGFTIGSFAARLKEIATIACRMKEKDRELLQKLGNEIRKDFPNYWIDVLMSKVDRTAGDFTIDDLRFKNELEASINNGFLVVRITAPRELRFQRLGIQHPIEVTEQENHPSEIDLDDAQLLEIDGSVDKNIMYKNIDAIVENYEGLRINQSEMLKTWQMTY